MSVPNLLRPEQIEEAKSEIRRIEHSLTQPHLQDRGLAGRQLQVVQKSLDIGVPQPFEEGEVDAQARREVTLREELVVGMPTQAEMRKAPPGAVSKHISWEQRNKGKLAEWKYVRQRLHADAPDPDIANFERYRPVGGAGEMSMDGALIPGTQYFMPEKVTVAEVMSETEKTALAEISPEIAGKMALLDNDQRADVLSMVRGMLDSEPVKKPRKKSTRAPMSEEQRKAFGERMAKARAAKKPADVEETI